MSIFQRIINWNNERGLLKLDYDHKNEISFIIEETLESTGKYDSLSARSESKRIAEEICQDTKSTDEQKVDSFADIIVFATGSIAKLGYNPDIAMDEVLKHIESRTGKIIDGKFVKDRDVEVYQPVFSKAKIK